LGLTGVGKNIRWEKETMRESEREKKMEIPKTQKLSFK